MEYNFEDFIQDEFFRKWVKNPDQYSVDFWKSYLRNYPEKAADVQKAKYFILSLSFPQKNYTPPNADEIEASYQSVINDTFSTARKIKGNNRPWYYLMAAAVFVVFLISLAVGSWNKDIKVVAPDNTLVDLIEKQVPPGQKLTVKLQDGSVVKLNSGSKIIYPSEFSEDRREVYFEGEAFFQVTKNIRRPFIVKSDNLVTTVLGTSFVVKAYKQEKQIQVAVLTGKVLVEEVPKAGEEPKTDKMYLLPMEGVTYSTESNELVKEKVDYNKVFSWKDNVIYFENANFQEVINTLSKWYGKEFDVRTNISNDNDFSAMYDNRSLELVLEGVSFSFGFQYKFADDKVIIY